MSVIAKAIADRQSEIERLQAEIKALNDVDKILGTSAPPAKPAARRSSSRRTAAAATPVVDPARRPADEEAPCDVGRTEEGGVRADDRLLGRAQIRPSAERKPRSSPPPARRRVRAAAGRPAVVPPNTLAGSQQIAGYPTQGGHWFRGGRAQVRERLRLARGRPRPEHPARWALVLLDTHAIRPVA